MFSIDAVSDEEAASFDVTDGDRVPSLFSSGVVVVGLRLFVAAVVSASTEAVVCDCKAVWASKICDV